MPNDKTASFDTFGPEKQQHVGIIGLTSNKKVIIVRQFRFGPEKIMDELPGRTVDEGEDLKASAKREFSEETGYTVGDIEYIGPFHKDAYMNATWHYFIAIGCKLTGQQKLDAEEHIEVRLVSINELLQNAKHGYMTEDMAV